MIVTPRACGLAPPFTKDGCFDLVDSPIEIIVIAGPRVDLAAANLAVETAGMLVGIVLPGRGVGQPAIGASEIFGLPYVACHARIMRSIDALFQRVSLPSSMSHYLNRRKAGGYRVTLSQPHGFGRETPRGRQKRRVRRALRNDMFRNRFIRRINPRRIRWDPERYG